MGCLPLMSPSTHPRGELQVATVGSMLYLMSLGDVIIFIFSLCNLFYTLYIISEGEKKCWKVFKIGERLPLKCGEVINKELNTGRHCRGCLWFGLGAEPEASEMATILFSPCFLFPLQWKNSCFSPAPSFTSGWWQADKSTTEYFLCLAEESPRCLCGKEWHSMQGSCLQRSCQKFPSPSLQFSSSCSFPCFFHLCSYWKKTKQMKLTCFPQIERWLTNTSSCQTGVYIKDDTTVERSCYCCWLVHIFSIFPCD